MPSILTTDEYAAQAADLEPGETITDDMAKTIASWWHGGRDHNITALSHGREWSAPRITEELDALITRDAPERSDLRLLREWVQDQTINSVWSSHGHTFIGDDDDMSCLTCGARYELVHAAESAFSDGRYRTFNGDDPTECTGDTSMVHGEAPCDCDAEDGCEHCRHDCNCMVCTG